MSFSFEPAQFIAGWQENAGRLFIPTLSHARVGDEVAIRIGIYGQAIRATLFGKVSMVRRVGRPALPPGIVLHLEAHSIAAAGLLAMAARGEPIVFKDRAPRWSVRQLLHVRHGDAKLEVTTVNVSEGGCAVLWPGPLPLAGDEIRVRLGAGLLSPSLRAVVCWSDAGADGERAVGLKIVSAGRGGRAWRRIVESAERSGVPAA